MRSIHRRLSLSILPCFAILWAAGGIAVYVSVQKSLIKTLDVELETLVRPIRLSPLRGLRLGEERRMGDEDSGTYFQLWDTDGEMLRKSPSLDQLPLEFSPNIEGSSRYFNQRLSNGDHVRAYMSSPSESPPRRLGAGTPQGLLVVAKSMQPIEDALRRWMIGLLASSLLAFAFAAALLRLSLKSGLRPLDRLASSASEIDASSLAARFDPGGMPNELKPIAQTLNDLLARLERSFDRERRVSADLAHELRTPVASLKSLGEVALKWPEQATSENYEDVCEISNGMAKTIESMLLLARLEDGSVQPTTTRVDLEQLVEKQCEDLSEPASAAELEFDIKLDEAPGIDTDRDLLEIIVSNLLRNAVNHAPAKSLISIVSGTDGTLLEVSNPAPDLEADDLPHLFERFWQSDESRSRDASSGLGLSIARSAASAIGLNLSAELDENDQVTFRIFEETA